MEGGGIIDINFGRTMEDGGYYETTKAIESLVTGKLTIPKVTSEVVEEGIGEV